MSTRRITAVSSSRADYSHLRWPLKALADHPDLDPELIVFGAHLSPQFGHTVDEIDNDGIPIRARLECLLSSDTDVGMAKTIGLATVSLADELARDRPDLLLLIADRYEMLAPASVALALRIPIAHIEGGEISEGAIDDAVRNALTKMSHVHLTPHDNARQRVLDMGEEPWRVTTVGAPSLDHLHHSPLLGPELLRQNLNLQAGQPLSVVAYHPVTLADDTTRECQALFTAMAEIPGIIAFCFPNADAGSHSIIEQARAFCANDPTRHIFVNLPAAIYFSLLQAADIMLGNSSSGIMETPSFALPTINIGWRQRGRLCAANILSVEPHAGDILNAVSKACSPEFRRSLAGLKNPYGEGDAGSKIASTLAGLPSRERLLEKKAGP